jgi:nicotinic acid phosphoribosyltransferase
MVSIYTTTITDLYFLLMVSIYADNNNNRFVLLMMVSIYTTTITDLYFLLMVSIYTTTITDLYFL